MSRILRPLTSIENGVMTSRPNRISARAICIFGAPSGWSVEASTNFMDLMYHPKHPNLNRLLVGLSSGLLLITVLTVIAADPAEDQKLHGTWVPIQAELGGRPMPEAVLKKITLKLNDGKYAVSVAGEPDKGNYTLDSATKPKSMVVSGTEGPNTGKSFPAIYEFIDSDTLRICYDLSGKQRPAGFKTMPGTSLYLVTYQRKKE
jgi:uncharacterized protein (TIGR03067 family)